MVKIDLITGFLGAGKTTFIQRYLQWLKQKDLKVAIIENEFGKAGIDCAILKGQTDNISELSGGCICCGLKVGFHDLLIKLSESGEYERIIVEPSGIFNLDDFFDVTNSENVKKYAQVGTVATIVDPTSLIDVDQAVTDMLYSQLHSTNLILLSKISTSDNNKIKTLTESIDHIFWANSAKRTNKQKIVAQPWENLNDCFFSEFVAYSGHSLPHKRRLYDHTNTYNSSTLHIKNQFSVPQLKEIINDAFNEQYGKVLRIKGYLTSQDNQTLLINCTKNRLCIEIAKERQQSAINIIGKNINRSGLNTLFSNG